VLKTEKIGRGDGSSAANSSAVQFHRHFLHSEGKGGLGLSGEQR